MRNLIRFLPIAAAVLSANALLAAGWSPVAFGQTAAQAALPQAAPQAALPQAAPQAALPQAPVHSALPQVAGEQAGLVSLRITVQEFNLAVPWNKRPERMEIGNALVVRRAAPQHFREQRDPARRVVRSADRLDFPHLVPSIRHSPRSLRNRFAARQGRHGRGVSSSRHAARPGGGD